MQIRENVTLAPYTTLRVGGVARYFTCATSEDEVMEALRWARERGLRVFVLGGGSNLLVSDAGFAGLVLRVEIGGIGTHAEGGRRIYSAGAGVEWETLVARAVADDCAGLECLSGIPGSVGGTPVQNVGAYGQDVSETIARVFAIDCGAIDCERMERVEFSGAECGFGYRLSRFNGVDRGRYIVTRVEYALVPGGAPKLAYAELQRRFANAPRTGAADRSRTQLVSGARPTLAAVREAVLAIRRGKGMVLDENDPESRSAGSFFKNPVVSQAEYERIATAAQTAVPHFAADGGKVKLAAAWLIEQAGIARGFTLGRAAISAKHTLALVNRGGATAAEILALKDYVQQRVRERFGVELHPEPVMLGFESA